MRQSTPLMHFAMCLLALSATLPSISAYTSYIDRNFGEKHYCFEGYEQKFSTNDYYDFNMYESICFCSSQCFIDRYTNTQRVSAFLIINTIGLTMQANLAGDSDPYSYVTIDFTYFGVKPMQIQLLYPSSQIQSYTPTVSSPPAGYVLPSTDASNYSFTVFETYPLYYPTATDPSFDVSDSANVFCGNRISQIKTDSIKIPKSNLHDPQSALVVQFSTLNQYETVNLRSIRISKNCIDNCLICYNDNSCSTCMSGLASYQFSSGIIACEQSGSVCSSLSNCLSCAVSGSDSVCLSCFPGFNLSSGSCSANTPSASCTSTQYNYYGVCMEYSQNGYYEDRIDSSFIPITSLTPAQIQTTFKCPQGQLVIAYKSNNYSTYSCKCFFDSCLSCSTISRCDICASGYTFDLSAKLCKSTAITSNPFVFSQSVTSTGYLFKIVFSKGILYPYLTNSDFQVVISDFTDFTYNFDGFKNGDTIEISVTCAKMVKSKTASITFTNLAFVTGNVMATSAIFVNLEGFFFLSQSEYDTASSVETIANVFATIIIWILVPISLLGYFGIIMYTSDMIAFLYYDLYIAVRFPINVSSFAQAFKILQLDFVINFFGTLVNSDTFQDSKVQWMKQPTDGYFLASTGQMISVFFVIILLYLFTKMMAKMEFAYISDYFQRAVIQTWEFSALIDGVWVVYIYVLMGVLIQLYDPSCSDVSCSLNKTLFSFSFVITAVFPFFVTYLIRYMNKQKFEKYLTMKLMALVSGIRLFTVKDLLTPKEDDRNFRLGNDEPGKQQEQDSPQLPPAQEQIRFASSVQMKMMGRRDKFIFICTKYTVSVLYLRKVLFCLIIAFLYTQPYVQIVMVSIMNFVMAVYFIFVKPYQSRYENIKQSLSEIFLIIYQIFIMILVSDSETQKEQDRISMAWGIIVIASFLIIWHVISILITFWKIARAAYLKWKSNKEQAKISPKEGLFNPNFMDNSSNFKNQPILIFDKNNKSLTGFNGSNILDINKGEEAVDDKTSSPKKNMLESDILGMQGLKRNESKPTASINSPEVSPHLQSPLRRSRASIVLHKKLIENLDNKQITAQDDMNMKKDDKAQILNVKVDLEQCMTQTGLFN